MFETAEFRVQFQHVNFQKNKAGESTGRYDTLCNIYRKDNLASSKTTPLCSGLAVLHPNDAPNKVIGKKVALLKAIIDGNTNGRTAFYIKSKRTEIWKAFWAWVASWKYIDESCPVNPEKMREHIINLEDQLKAEGIEEVK